MMKYKWLLFLCLFFLPLAAEEKAEFSVLIHMPKGDIATFTPFKVTLVISYPPGFKVDEKHWVEILRLFKEMTPDLKILHIRRLNETQKNTIYEIELESESPKRVKASLGVIPLKDENGNVKFLASGVFEIAFKSSNDKPFQPDLRGFYPVQSNLPLEIEPEVKRQAQGQEKLKKDQTLFLENVREKRRFILLSLLILSLLSALLFINAFGFLKRFQQKDSQKESLRSLKGRLVKKLKTLKKQPLENEEEIKHFYSELSYLLKESVDQSALAETSEEFIVSLKEKSTAEEFELLETLLENADRVKFSKETLIKEKGLHDLSVLEQWIYRLPD